MEKYENNYAFIDSENLYKGIKSLEWKLDYQKFRITCSRSSVTKKEKAPRRDVPATKCLSV